jgi:hypothetical protein
MKKYIILVLAFILVSLVAQAKPMLKGLTAEEYASRQTDMLKEKIELPQELINNIGKINLDYANQIYILCDADKSYAEIKMAFYDLVDKKKAEISNLLPEDKKEVYSDLENKFKEVTWNEIKKYIKKRGVK